MKLISNVDFFGRQFHFLINSSTHFQTAFGGIISILSFFLFILLGYLFGKDIWYHKNPTIYESLDLKPNYTEVYLDEYNLFFPFAIQDYFGNFIEFEGNFFISIEYNTVQDQKLIQKELMPLTKCSEFNTSINTIQTHKYDDYYCVNFTNRNIVGEIGKENYKYFSIQILLCPTGVEYYSSKICSSWETLEEFTKDRIFFSYLLPKFYVQQNNYTFPITMEYEITKVEISAGLSLHEKIGFTEVNVLDDTNFLIARESSKKSFWEGESIQKENFVINEENFQDGKKLIPIYTIVLFTTQKLKVFTRTYMKLMELISLMGGFIQIFKIIFSFICSFVNFYEQIAFLFWNSFEFTDNNLESFAQSTQDNLKRTGGFFMDNSGMNSLQQKLAKKVPQKNNFFESDTQIIKTFTEIREPKKRTKGIDVYNTFYDICCSKNKKIRKYFRKFGYEFIVRRFDILTYNKLIKNFNIVRQMALTKEQNIAINLSKNPPLFSAEELENYFGINNEVSKKAREKEMFYYFKNKNFSNLDKESQYIYAILDKNIQNKIYMNNVGKKVCN